MVSPVYRDQIVVVMDQVHSDTICDEGHSTLVCLVMTDIPLKSKVKVDRQLPDSFKTVIRV